MKRLLGIILVVLVEIIFLDLFNNNYSELIPNPKPVLLSNLPQSAAKTGSSTSLDPNMKIAVPTPGQFYQGVYLGDITILDRAVGLAELNAYEQAAGKSVT